MRKLARADQYIDERQQIEETVVDVVDIRGHNCSRFTSDLGQSRTRRRVVSVEVQNAAARGNGERRFVGAVTQPLVAVPDDRAFAVARVDENESNLVVGALDNL